MRRSLWHDKAVSTREQPEVFPNDRALRRVENNPRVDYAEQVQVVRAVEQRLPWGINRIEADKSSTLAGNGSGTTDEVIAGVEWVTKNAVMLAIANMSFAGEASKETKALDAAVRGSAASGVSYSISAGNDGANACNQSPASAGRTWNDGTWNKNNGVMTVAATNARNMEISWSNYGPCVDIWAPGASVLSTRWGGGTTAMSGTSMAAPHVGGGGALYRKSHPGTGTWGVERALKNAAKWPGTKRKSGASIRLEYVGGF